MDNKSTDNAIRRTLGENRAIAEENGDMETVNLCDKAMGIYRKH